MASNSLRFEPLTPIIGAEVHGIDLGEAFRGMTAR